MTFHNRGFVAGMVFHTMFHSAVWKKLWQHVHGYITNILYCGDCEIVFDRGKIAGKFLYLNIA